MSAWEPSRSGFYAPGDSPGLSIDSRTPEGLFTWLYAQLAKLQFGKVQTAVKAPLSSVDTQNAAISTVAGLRTGADIAAFLGVTRRYLDYHLFIRPAPYRTFDIAKKSGGTRTIEAPPHPVRKLQARLAPVLRDAYERKRPAFGFCSGGSIVGNASAHVGARLILNLDLADFFHSITFARVFGVFGSYPFNLPQESRTILARLCTTNGRLPQGAPTSPILTNYVCRGLDTQLARLARSYHCFYTRYADDITFSTRKAALSAALVKSRAGHNVALGATLVAAIEKHGFTINSKKIWMRSQRERQTVTGLVVNVRTNVPRPYVRDLRAALHRWRKQNAPLGCDSTLQTELARSRAQNLRGKLAHLQQVRGRDDPLWARYAIQFAECVRRDLREDRVVTLQGSAALDPRLLRHAVYLIQIVDHDGHDLSNGTGFWLQGHGLVTNHHVVDVEALATEYDCDAAKLRLRAAPASDLNDWRDLRLESSSAHHDLALLSAARKPYAQLVPSQQDTTQGARIQVVGFPNFGPGADWRVEAGKITQIRVSSGVNLLQLSATIYEGNSGGPVLGPGGTVLGVASHGREHLILPNSAIDLAHLNTLSRVDESSSV